MKNVIMSRRWVLEGSACILASSVGMPHTSNSRVQGGLTPTNDRTIRTWYSAWEKKDWLPLDMLLAEDFTFSSAAGDDHISKSAFKAQCWESQIDFIDRFDLQRVFGSGNEAFVMYVCRTKNGKAFRNVEYLRLKNGKLQAIECYFGMQASYPSAVSKGQG